MSACCKDHNRLDRKIHVLGYVGGKECGSVNHEVAEVKGNPGVYDVVVDDEGQPIKTKPMYCCMECPSYVRPA